MLSRQTLLRGFIRKKWYSIQFCEKFDKHFAKTFGLEPRHHRGTKGTLLFSSKDLNITIKRCCHTLSFVYHCHIWKELF